MIESNNANIPLRSDVVSTKFVQRLADELGDLITSIRLSGELLKTELADNLRDELRQIIVTESTRMESIIERALYFTALTESTLHPLRLQEILDLSLKASGADIPIKIEVSPNAEELLIHGDPTKVVRLLHELIRNAVEAGATSLRIVERLVSDPTGTNHREIRIIDDGEGFNGTSVEELIAPFFTTRSGQAGLGLAIARSIAESHGWSIESRPGETSGSEVVIRLPE